MVYTPTSPNTIYRLLIVIEGIDPPIWRLVDVQATLSLSSLHGIIQWAMGWENRHRYFFYRGEFSYVERPIVHEWSVGKELDADCYSLKKVFGHRGRYLEYIYDLTDHWRHHIWLEDFFVARPQTPYPRLIDGGGACPPEDFGGSQSYQQFLNDHRSENVDATMKDFDPDDFAPHPRASPDARIQILENTIEREPVHFDAQAAEMLGGLIEDVESLLSAVDREFRRDLCRALEDLVLTEDSLPPLTTEVLEEAFQEDIGIDEFLIQVILRHQELSNSYSYAPLHAARILSRWPVDEATDVFLTVLKETDDDKEGTIDTMIEVLTHTTAGVEKLIEALDEMEPNRLLRAIDILVQQRIHDERIFAQLKKAMDQAGPENPTAPFILSYYDDPRSIDLLNDALQDALKPLTADLSNTEDEQLLEQSDYALFLSEMVIQAGGEISENDRRILRELENFFWSAEGGPGYAPRPR